MTLLVTYQVIVRYFFNSPNAYTEVISKYMFVWLIMYGSAYVFGLREHMNIAVVRDKMPTKIRIIIEMISELIIALFTAGVLVYGGFKQMGDQMVQLDAALQIPMGIIYSAVPISSCFILFYFIFNERKLFTELKSTSVKGRL
jgi:TRAP-type C4-dicarboxylate transport system permease small subunit